MKILNLYSGIGGNRKLWNFKEITSVEYNEEIAMIYKDLYPNDNIIISDAHIFLEKNYKEFDFIWSSPPCQSHSKIRMMASKNGSYNAIMPNMNLWSEIIFMQHFCNNIKWVVENVNSYYKPLIQPTQKIGRHLFWSNFEIPFIDLKDGLSHNERGSSKKGFFDLSNYKIKHRKDQIIRNCVEPNIGEYILKCAINKNEIKNTTNQIQLFT